jgi:Peptidase A4 family
MIASDCKTDRRGATFKAVHFVAASLFILLFLLPSFMAPQLTFVSAPFVRAATNGSTLGSINWSGYAVNGTAGSITVATASWTIPAVTCPTSGNTYAALWVGIDGFQSTTVEQTGTDSDCNNGVATYYAWYEFYPKLSRSINTISANPGDRIGAVISYSTSSGLFTIAIKDFTTNQGFKTSSSVSGAQRSSAEFIVEAPEVCTLKGCSLTALSDFGTAGFGLGNTGIALNCGLIMNGVKGSIGSFPSTNVWPIDMVSQSNPSIVKSQPSALTDSGTSFNVTWENAGP